MGGGIGVTPMISFAHRLFFLKKDFVLHYSTRKIEEAGYMNDINSFKWKENVKMHFSNKNSRANFDEIFKNFELGSEIYICGSERYMDAVKKAAIKKGINEDVMHFEYFLVPEEPDYINSRFKIKLAKSGKEFIVPPEKTSTEILNENGFQVDVKCSDGICGVCMSGLISGDVEHRDFILSKSQRKNNIILCKSRASKPGGVIVIDL